MTVQSDARVGVFLDFDGVLFDTVREVYAVCRTVKRPTLRIEAIDYTAPDYQRFRSLRYLVTSARSYYYLEEAIKQTPEAGQDTAATYRRLEQQTRHEEPARQYESQFFLARKRLRDTQFEPWLQLNAPFPFLARLKPLFPGHGSAFSIVTTKDRGTVRQLLHHADVDLPSNQITDADDFRRLGSKRTVIERLQVERNITRGILVDDARDHVRACQAIKGLQVFQPDWGYVGPEDPTAGETAIVKAIQKLLKGCSDVRS